MISIFGQGVGQRLIGEAVLLADHARAFELSRCR
jgi:hypothetical protein